MTHARSKWLRRSLLILAGGAALYALLAFLTSFRARRLVNRIVRDWATEQVAQQSDSVYVLQVGQLHFDWARRRVTLDSMLLITDTARNNLRQYPRPTISGILRTCTIGGLNIPRLVLGKGLAASQFGCNTVRWDMDAPADSASVEAERAIRTARPMPVAAPRPAPAPPPAAPTATATAAAESARAPGVPRPGPLVAFQRTLVLPDQVPSLRIARLVFPTVAISIVSRQPNGDRGHFNLGRARIDITDIVIDPEQPEYRERPAFAQNVEFQADSADFRPDTARSARFGRLRLNLTDSTATIEDFAVGPLVSDAEFQRRSPYRRDRIRLAARRLEVRGFAIGDYSLRSMIRARAVQLDSLRFEIRSDKRKPARPGPRRPHRSPQVALAAMPRGISLDTLKAVDAVIVYEEFAPRRDRPGRLTISQVNVLATNIRHVPGRQTLEDPLVMDIRGRLMGQGDLAVHLEMPLDAPRLTMRVRGTVGPFDAMAANALIEEIMPARIKSGRIDGVAFQFAAANDRARGTITPRYHDLAADITGEGMTGVMGSNPLGGLLRGAAEAVQGAKVRGSNPERPDRPALVGRIDYQFSGESLPSFFWNVIKGGLLGVALK